jgi:hypothetical protein
VTTYIIYSLTDGTHTITESRHLAMGAVPCEDMIVADVSHWDDDDIKDFEGKHYGDQIGQLEGIEMIDEIRAELARRPL